MDLITRLQKWSERWPDFLPEEVLSPDQVTLFKDKGIVPYSFRSLDKLQKFRDYVGLPLLVNFNGFHRRGARSTVEATNLMFEKKGTIEKFTFHFWCAFDVSCPELDTQKLAEEAFAFGGFHGIGIYPTWVHLDDRDTFNDEVIVWYAKC